MKEKSAQKRIDGKEAAALLASRDRILIISHRSPDGDTLGSGLGLYYALRQKGKMAQLVCSDGFPERFDYLYGDRSFEQEIAPDLIVTVDMADAQLLGSKYLHLRDKIDLCIDHHISNTEYAKQVCLKTDASSTCELMEEIIYRMGCTFDAQISNCLYTGIVTDTGCFQFPNTTPQTHTAAARLMEEGADYATINEKLFGTKSRARVEIERYIYRTLELTNQGQIAFVHIPRKLLTETGADDVEIDGVSGMPRQIEGVQIAITMREQEPEVYRVSFRSAKGIDVSALAGQFGGGGHVRASGCTITGTFDQCKERLLLAAEKALAGAES